MLHRSDPATNGGGGGVLNQPTAHIRGLHTMVACVIQFIPILNFATGKSLR